MNTKKEGTAMLNILHDYYPHSVPDWLETAPGLAAKANRFGIFCPPPGTRWSSC